MLTLLRMRRRDPAADFTRAALETVNASAAVRAAVGHPLAMVGRFQGTAGFNAVDGVLAARSPAHPLLVVEVAGSWSRPAQGWAFSTLRVIAPAAAGAGGTPPPPGAPRPDGFRDGAVTRVV